MERVVAGVFRYQLVDEDGEEIGEMISEQSSWVVGDLVPCGSHMFEVRRVEGSTLHVRKVI